MATQTKKPPLTVSNPWWGHDPSDKQLVALWAYEKCPRPVLRRRGWPWQNQLTCSWRLSSTSNILTTVR